MRKLLLLLLVSAAPLHAASTYTLSVLFSTSTPQAATQKDFLASTTNQFNVDLFKTPWGSDTYNLTIKGKNPNYLPPVKSTMSVDATALLAALVATSTSTYVYGWANGVEYERKKDVQSIGNYIINCSSPTFFDGLELGWNSATCTTALQAIQKFIYQQSFSTPTPVGI